MIRTALTIAGLAGFVAAQEAQRPPKPGVSVQIPLHDSSSRELHLYLVRPYVDAILDAQEGVDLFEPDDRREAARDLVRRLRDAIRTFVQPAFEDGEEVQALGHEHLALIGRPAQHEWIRHFLELQSENAETIALVDIEILRAKPGTFAALGVGKEPAVHQGNAVAAFRRLLIGPDNEPVDGVDRLSAPRVAILALQRAQVSAIEQVSYVKDYAVHKLDDGSIIADPEVDVVQAGISIDGSFTIVEKDTIGLSWSVEISDLLRPIPVFETKLEGVGAPVKIQLPNVTTTRFAADVVMTPGALSVFPGPELRGDRVVLLMSVARLERGSASKTGSRDEVPSLELRVPGERRR